MNKIQCCKSVATVGVWSGWHKCKRAATVERAGKHYCSIHDPEYVKKKSESNMEKWRLDCERRRKEHAHQALFEPLLNALIEARHIIIEHHSHDIMKAEHCVCPFCSSPDGDKKLNAIAKAIQDAQAT